MTTIPANTTPVVSAARKLLFKTKAGPVVGFPENAKISEYGANNESPVIVVFNGTDPSWQGVDEGNFVIVNEVPEVQAETALSLYNEYGQTNEAIQKALDYLNDEGLNDQYTTNQNFVAAKLSPAGMMLEDGSGIMKRDDRDVTSAWQENGVYYVAPSGEARRIEADILMRTYRNVDGSPIDLGKIPSV